MWGFEVRAAFGKNIPLRKKDAEIESAIGGERVKSLLKGFAGGVVLVYFVGMGMSAALAADPKTTRVAIVGAGSSGLTSALALKLKGYAHVVVFEKEDHVGGKVLSVPHGPLRPLRNDRVDVGAVVMSQDYRVIRWIADQVGMKWDADPMKRVVYQNASGELQKQGAISYILNRFSEWELLVAFLKWKAWIKIYGKELERPGFAHLPSEMGLPMDVYAKKKGFLPVAQIFESVLVGCGYGYYNEVPAAYYLKLLPWLVPLVLNEVAGQLLPTENSGLYYFKNGNQEVWERLAARLVRQGVDLRLNTPVTQVKREGGQVRVITSQGEELFDSVILTTNPTLNRQLLDFDPQESELWSKPKSVSYWSSWAQATGLKENEVAFYVDHLRRSSVGRLTSYLNRWKTPEGQPGLWVTYQFADQSHSPEQLAQWAEKDLKRAGAEKAVILKQWNWEYFPYVESADFISGFYRDLEATQGQGGVYFAGGLMNFETKETNARYALDLVDRFF